MIAVDRIVGNPLVTNFNPNSNVQTQFQDNYAIDFLAFRLTGTAVLAGYTTNPARFVEAEENLIQTLQVTATGNSAGATTDTLCSVDGPFLRLKQLAMLGVAPTKVAIGTSNGSYQFETNLKKFFVDPRSNKSTLTRLFTASLSSLTAAFQFRDQNAMIYGGVGGTTTLSGVQVIAQAREYLGMVAPNPSPYVKETQRTYNISAQTNGFVADRIPVGNIVRRQYFKGMLGAVPYADPSDSLFGAVGKPEGPHLQLVINSATTKLDQTYQQIRASNAELFGIAIPTGYCIYEPARNRMLKNSLPFGNVVNAQNNVDVNFTAGSLNTLQITDEQIINCSAAQFVAA